MKTTIKYNLIIVSILAIVLVTACKKEEDKALPEINNFELGYDNSKTALAGEELHMDGGVVAEAGINTIAITIHPEEGHLKDGGEWEVDTVYSRFSGLKNTDFHEHIDVPADADTGHYHFHFVVTDMDGYQTVHEDEFEVILP